MCGSTGLALFNKTLCDALDLGVGHEGKGGGLLGPKQWVKLWVNVELAFHMRLVSAIVQQDLAAFQQRFRLCRVKMQVS